MKLKVRQYGDPVLRQKGARVEKITAEIRKLVADMFDTMYEARGVGLAAQQVGHALQLAVIDVRGIKDRPSTMQIGGKTVEAEAHMPLVLINPELKPGGEAFTGPEGCLSFPELSADIVRSDRVRLTAKMLDGAKFVCEATGLLSRALQHEVDHLNGILFIDRMSSAARAGMAGRLKRLQKDGKR